MFYFDTSALPLMICCWRRIMLGWGSACWAFNWLQIRHRVKRERARRISRSCFPTRLYGYLALSTRYGDAKTWRTEHEEFEKCCTVPYTVYPLWTYSTSRRRLSAVCYTGMGKNRVRYSGDFGATRNYSTTTVTVLGVWYSRRKNATCNCQLRHTLAFGPSASRRLTRLRYALLAPAASSDVVLVLCR